jgi:acetoin utilization protein AcuB
MRVRDWMTEVRIAVAPETPAALAADLLRVHRVRHLPVVDRDDRVVGIVSDRDLRLNMPSPATSLSAPEVNFLLLRLPVEQVMTAPVLTIGPDRPLRDAVTVMMDRKIGALPVTDDGRLVGIITEFDLLRALAQALDDHPAAILAARV